MLLAAGVLASAAQAHPQPPVPSDIAVPDGTKAGRFGETTYIQRIHTTGGVAPAAADCNAATTGTTREVPYTADYVFLKKAGRGHCHGTRD